MAKTVADVMNMVKENEVKFVDFRFTDTRGKEQHVTVPVSHFDEDKFTAGHAFDGSSIAGWKGIEASDMLLMPDPNTAVIDPFFEEPTLDPDLRRPRAGRRQALRARSALDRQARRGLPEGVGPGRHRLLRPGARVLHLRRRQAGAATCRAASSRSTPTKLPGTSSKDLRRRQHRPSSGGQGRLLPGAAGRQRRRTSAPRCRLVLESLGVPVEVHHHEVGGAGQNEIGTKFSTLVAARRLDAEARST